MGNTVAMPSNTVPRRHTIENKQDENFIMNIGYGVSLSSNNGNTYEVEDAIGRGGDGILFRCHDKKTGKLLVVKAYNRDIATDKRNAIINLLFNKDIPGLVKLVDYGEYENQMFDIYPYFKNGSIENRKFKATYIINYFIPLMNNVLKMIHDNGIIHRDIKPENILIDDNGKDVYLSDFSTLSLLDSKKSHITQGIMPISIEYSAVEKHMGMDCKESDYYALGITILNMLNGKSIYDGYSDSAIRECILNSNIPGLSKEYIHGLDLTGLSGKGREEDRIKLLVCGMTMYDKSIRWGYNKVVEWTKGVYSLPDEVLSSGFDTPFIWKGEKARNEEQMVKVLAADWNNVRTGCYNSISKWLMNKRADIASDIDKETENSAINWNDTDMADAELFIILNLISPMKDKIFWKNERFNSFNEWALYLLKKYDSSFEMLLKLKGISRYLKIIGNFKKLEDSEIKRIVEVEQYAISESGKEAYYRFVYLFLDKSAERYYSVNNISIHNISELCAFIEKNPDNIILKDSIVKNEMCAAWMWFEGYSQLFAIAIGGNKNDYFKSLLTFIDKVENGSRYARKVAISKSEKSYIFWTKVNIDGYKSNSLSSEKVMNDIRNINIDENMSVEEIFEKLDTAEHLYKRFASINIKNPYEVVINDNNEPDYIIPLKLGNALICRDNNSMPVPFEYAEGKVIDKNSAEKMSVKAQEKLKEVVNETKDEILEKIQKNEYYRNHLGQMNLLMIMLLFIEIFAIIKIAIYISVNFPYMGIIACLYPTVLFIFTLLNRTSYVKLVGLGNYLNRLNNSLNVEEECIRNHFSSLHNAIADCDYDYKIICNNHLNSVINETQNIFHYGFENKVKSRKKIIDISYIISAIGFLGIFSQAAIKYTIPFIFNSCKIPKGYLGLGYLGLFLGVIAGFLFFVGCSNTLNCTDNERFVRSFMLLLAPVFGALGIIVFGLVVALIVLAAIIIWGLIKGIMSLIVTIIFIVVVVAIIYGIISG